MAPAAEMGDGQTRTSTDAAADVKGLQGAKSRPPYVTCGYRCSAAVGLTFFDTMDGCFTSVACGWAFAWPVRKVYYNLVITGLSIAGRGSDLSGTDVRTLVSDRLAAMRVC